MIQSRRVAINPFEYLGIEPNATEQQIRSAYRQKLKQLHPDKHPGVPDHIVAQLASFTQELNDVYKELSLNLDHFRSVHSRPKQEPSKTKGIAPNPFSLKESLVRRIEKSSIEYDALDRLVAKLKFPQGVTNLVLTALRMRSVAIRVSDFDETKNLQLVMMFLLGTEIAQLILGERIGESDDVLELEPIDLKGYAQGAIDDAEYFMSVSDSDLHDFVASFPIGLKTWISNETRRLSNGSSSFVSTLQRFILSGIIFILFQA